MTQEETTAIEVRDRIPAAVDPAMPWWTWKRPRQPGRTTRS